MGDLTAVDAKRLRRAGELVVTDETRTQRIDGGAGGRQYLEQTGDGTAIGAIGVRSLMTVIVVWLLKIPGLLLVGGGEGRLLDRLEAQAARLRLGVEHALLPLAGDDAWQQCVDADVVGPQLGRHRLAGHQPQTPTALPA